MARHFRTRPSEFLDIEDAYTAYCIDEACAYILGKIESGEEPQFKIEYTSFRDMYRHLGL